VQEESLEPDAPAEPPAVSGSRANPPADNASPDNLPAGNLPAADASSESGASDNASSENASSANASSAVPTVNASGEECEEPDEVVSQTAWRTFTAAPPRHAAQP
jgi:hypothetical protein